MDSEAYCCSVCREAYNLPDGDGERDGAVKCPQCEFESSLPDGNVFDLQEDNGTNEMNRPTTVMENKPPAPDLEAGPDVQQPADAEKIKMVVDRALVQAAENLVLLENIHQTLSSGLVEQVKMDRSRLELEIQQAADKASHAVHKWKETQLSQLTNHEARFTDSQSEVILVQRRIKDLEIAMQMAKEVRRVPFLEQYCTLDKVLETMQAPVDRQDFNMKCITQDSAVRCVFHSENLNQSLMLSLIMEVSVPKQLPKAAPKGPQPSAPSRRSSWQSGRGRGKHRVPSPGPSRDSSPGAALRRSRSSHRSRQNSLSDSASPDMILEEVLIEEHGDAGGGGGRGGGGGGGTATSPPPTGPELANDWRVQRRKRTQYQRSVTQWVVLSHVVNPSHFYVCYVAERRESERLTRKIKQFCSRESSRFTARDSLDSGCMVFARWSEGIWGRSSVMEILQTGSLDPVRVCPVSRLDKVRVFFLDSGLSKTFSIQREQEHPEVLLKVVNESLRKVGEAGMAELAFIAPQAIRCSLKDLVPYNLVEGWSSSARLGLLNVVGSAAVEMRVLGKDGESLLVDLRKAPMDQSSDVSISVREYLVFIEVARFYSPVRLGRRPLLFHAPPPPSVHTELSAVVSHINSPSDFYVQLDDNTEFLLLSEKLQRCYSSAGEDLNIYCPVMEQACVARDQDQVWYRAQVIAHPGGRKVEVRFVDFGRKEILSVSDLKKIKDEFFALPARAIHCRLCDVVPADGETWSESGVGRFVSLALHKPVTMVTAGRAQGAEPQGAEPLEVSLFGSNTNGLLENLGELLVREQHAAFRDGVELQDAGCDESVVWDSVLDPGDQDQDQDRDQDFSPQLQIPKRLTDLKVRVTHVNSPSSFYVQFTQNDTQLRRVSELVNQHCSDLDPVDLDPVDLDPVDQVWRSDMDCAAHISGVWERGRICGDVTAGNIAEVMRCDHGNKVKLPVRDLRPLPSSLVGSLALECTLTGIRPAGGGSTWTVTACERICSTLTGASAVLTIKELSADRPVPVSVFLSDSRGQFFSMADRLLVEGVALREKKSRDTVLQSEPVSPGPPPPPPPPAASPPVSSFSSPGLKPRPAPRTFSTPEKVQTSLYPPPELPSLGHVQINVSAVGEDGLIYTRTLKSESQLVQLWDRIQQSMKTLPCQKPYTWKSVLGCAVIGPDMQWYRGHVLEVLGGHVKVEYVDYGQVENIPVVHVYPTLLCADVPQLRLPCRLNAIDPVGGRWQPDAVALMKEVLLGRCVDMQVLELPADPRGPLTVELFLDGLSLSRILCHHQHASLDRPLDPIQGRVLTVSAALLLDDWDIDIKDLRAPEEPVLGPYIDPKLPQEGEKFPVRVKHLWTPNQLSLWPVGGDALGGDALERDALGGETLDEALIRINEDLDTLQPLSSFHCGGPCLAEYSDGKFYRAQLVRFSSLDPVLVLVQHVDFGSDDTLPTSKLRELPAELMRFPARALKVRVAGFKPPSVNQQESVLPYSPGWSVKAALKMIDLLHGDINATVVAREPELTVLLYNEDDELIHIPLVSSGLAELD